MACCTSAAGDNYRPCILYVTDVGPSSLIARPATGAFPSLPGYGPTDIAAMGSSMSLNDFIHWSEGEAFPVFPTTIRAWWWLKRKTLCRCLGHVPKPMSPMELRPTNYVCVRCGVGGSIRRGRSVSKGDI